MNPSEKYESPIGMIRNPIYGNQTTNQLDNLFHGLFPWENPIQVDDDWFISMGNSMETPSTDEKYLCDAELAAVAKSESAVVSTVISKIP